jgi:hypothetical protein
MTMRSEGEREILEPCGDIIEDSKVIGKKEWLMQSVAGVVGRRKPIAVGVSFEQEHHYLPEA